MWPRGRQPTRLPRPWDAPGKNTGVGCHFLLQCRKVKSESEVAQSCPTLHDPMDCSLPGSSIHGIFQARVLEWGAIAFSAMECYSAIKREWNLAICDMKEHRVYYTKWNKSEDKYSTISLVCGIIRTKFRACIRKQKKSHRWELNHINNEMMEKAMAPHSSILDWKIPWTEKPGRLQSMGLRRVRNGLATKQ